MDGIRGRGLGCVCYYGSDVLAALDRGGSEGMRHIWDLFSLWEWGFLFLILCEPLRALKNPPGPDGDGRT